MALDETLAQSATLTSQLTSLVASDNLDVTTQFFFFLLAKYFSLTYPFTYHTAKSKQTYICIRTELHMPGDIMH